MRISIALNDITRLYRGLSRVSYRTGSLQIGNKPLEVTANS